MRFPKDAPQSTHFQDLTSPYMGDDSVLRTDQILKKYNINDHDLNFMAQRGWNLNDMILLKNHFEQIMKQPMTGFPRLKP